MKKKMTSIYSFLLILLFVLNSSDSTNSYINLNDKLINEQLSIGTFVSNLNSDLLDTNKSQPVVYDLVQNQQFALLEDSKQSNGNSYFEVDPSGRLTTKRVMDREDMCTRRQCAEPCEQVKNLGSCRINLKVLMLPSYNIINLNVLIQDINDNKPQFRENSIVQKINENVPLGYKIPVDLAYDPDIGRNRVQFYELISYENPDQTTFRLVQNESSLHLVVSEQLDRETTSEYRFKLTAYDDGEPRLSSTLNITLEITDINDNNPKFEKAYYLFAVKENAPLDTVIGRVRANDLDDPDLNGKIIYSFVDNPVASNGASSNFLMQRGSVLFQNSIKKFDLDSSTGVIRLKSSLDYENEKSFMLTIEAKDAGFGSLPAYATVEINVQDVNDNSPEISASFLNTLHKNRSLTSGFVYDIYLPENTKANKFLAHVHISDKDSGVNGKFDWTILVNNGLFMNSSQNESVSNSVLKLIKLNNNSFTLNIGNTNLLDRERYEKHNVSIIAWDHGRESHRSAYNFSLALVDVNDNAPKFEQPAYELSIFENNEPHQVLFKVKALDADSPFGPNSNVTYHFKEKILNDYLFINSNGILTSKISFDREKIEKFIFNIIASDQGQPSLSSSASFVLNILDLNDNKPSIVFNTSYYHRFFKLDEKSASEAKSYRNKYDSTLYIRVGEMLPVHTRLIDFRATDKDVNENAVVEFTLNTSETNLPFKLDKDGRLSLVRALNKSLKNVYELEVICTDFGSNPGRLSSTLQLTVEIVDSNEYCIKLREKSETKRSRFLNRDAQFVDLDSDLFEVDYFLESDHSSKNSLLFELVTHKDLFEIEPTSVDSFSYKLKIKFKSAMTRFNISRLMLGKYTIRIRLSDTLNPTCSNLEQFTLIIGNSFISEKEIVYHLDNNLNAKLDNDNISGDESTPGNDLLFSSDDEPLSDNKIDETNESELNDGQFLFGPKYRVKPATFLDSDYVLLYILIVVILITGVLLIFIAVMCVFSKMKSKQYKREQSTLSSKLTTINKNDEDLSDNANFIIATTPSRKLKSSTNDLTHDSTVPNYTLDRKKKLRNGTLIYINQDEDEFIIPASNTHLRQYSTRSSSKKSYNQYVFTSIVNEQNLSSNYDESNSNPESVIDTTTLEDANDACTYPIIKINNYNSKSPNEHISVSSTSTHSSSSAYSSISHSDNQDSESSKILKNRPDQKFLSFKNNTHVNNSSNINTNCSNTKNNNINLNPIYNCNNHASFNL